MFEANDVSFVSLVCYILFAYDIQPKSHDSNIMLICGWIFWQHSQKFLWWIRGLPTPNTLNPIQISYTVSTFCLELMSLSWELGRCEHTLMWSKWKTSDGSITARLLNINSHHKLAIHGHCLIIIFFNLNNFDWQFQVISLHGMRSFLIHCDAWPHSPVSSSPFKPAYSKPIITIWSVRNLFSLLLEQDVGVKRKFLHANSQVAYKNNNRTLLTSTSLHTLRVPGLTAAWCCSIWCCGRASRLDADSTHYDAVRLAVPVNPLNLQLHDLTFASNSNSVHRRHTYTHTHTKVFEKMHTVFNANSGNFLLFTTFSFSLFLSIYTSKFVFVLSVFLKALCNCCWLEHACLDFCHHFSLALYFNFCV